MLHATDETKAVLKSLGKMLFKNCQREVLALIWSIQPQSSVQCTVVQFIPKGGRLVCPSMAE